MKYQSAFLLCLIITVFGFRPGPEETWQTVELVAHKIEISLPATPRDQEMGPAMGKASVLPDSTELGGMASDLSATGVTEEMLRALAETPEFAKQIKESMLADAGKGASIKNERKGKYKEKYTYLEFEVELLAVDDAKVNSTIRIIFYKSYFIMLAYKAGRGIKGTDLRDRFFNTLRLTE